MELPSVNGEGPGRIDCPLGCQRSNMMRMDGHLLCRSIVGMYTAPGDISQMHVKCEQCSHTFIVS